jgi:hypothetical protein
MFWNKLFGKKKNKPLEAPRVLDTVSLKDAFGNQYILRAQGETQFVDETRLAPETQSQVNVAQQGVSGLLQELGETQAQRQAGLDKRQQELYAPLANEISRLLDGQAAEVRSQQARRFGGSLNSTFGAMAMGGMATTRLRALESAHAGTYSTAMQEMLNLDQSRQQRFSALNHYLDTVEDRKQRYTMAGLNALQQARNLRQTALQRAETQAGKGNADDLLSDETLAALVSAAVKLA